MIGAGLKFGKGVFETVLVVEGRYLYWEEHIQRMKNSLAYLKIAYPNLEKELAEDQKKRQLDQGAYRFMVVEERPGQGRLYIESRPLPSRREKFRGQLASAIRDSRNLLHQHKTNNYLQNLLLLEEARAEGFDEVFFLNERGCWTEGSMTNLFFLKGGEVFTPPVADGLLAGIQRQQLINRLGQQGVKVRIESIPFEAIEEMEGAFASNSLIQIKEIESLAGKEFSASPEIQQWIQEFKIK